MAGDLGGNVAEGKIDWAALALDRHRPAKALVAGVAASWRSWTVAGEAELAESLLRSV